MLEPESPAPAFTRPDQDGTPVTLLCNVDKTLIRDYGVDEPPGFGVRRGADPTT